MNIGQAFLRGILPLVVLAIAVVATKRLVDTKPLPARRPRDERGVLVEVQPVKTSDHQVQVRAQGTVIPKQAIELGAEVSGRVVKKNPELTAGGHVRAGEVLLRIDDRDYNLSLAQRKAAVAQAEAELQLERGRKRVAEQEWRLFGKADAGVPELAQREPQLRSVELALKTAENGLKQARLTLDKTTVRAPFNAIVRENMTEVGRLVTPQQPLAELVGSDVFLVEVNLPIEELSWLRVPGVDQPLLSEKEYARLVEEGAEANDLAERTTFATVLQTAGPTAIRRNGFVTRLLGELDPIGRMARLLVAIRDPLGLRTSEDSPAARQLPLLLGAYVQVTLLGEALQAVVEVPRQALRDGDQVYVANAQDKLEIRPIEVVWRRADSVLVREGLVEGDRLIVSVMPSAVEGMELRVQERTAEAAVKAAPTKPGPMAEALP